MLAEFAKREGLEPTDEDVANFLEEQAAADEEIKGQVVRNHVEPLAEAAGVFALERVQLLIDLEGGFLEHVFKVRLCPTRSSRTVTFSSIRTRSGKSPRSVVARSSTCFTSPASRRVHPGGPANRSPITACI